MGGEEVGIVRYFDEEGRNRRRAHLSASQLEAIDGAVRKLLDDACRRAAEILRENRAVLELLRDELLKHKVIDAKTLAAMVARS